MKLITANKIYTGKVVLENKVVVINAANSVIDIVEAKNIDSVQVETFEGVLCPGFINTHCHVELSHLFGKVEKKTGLDNFIKEIELYRKADESIVLEAIKKADEQMYSNGIVAVGDICNTANTFDSKLKSKLMYHNFLEIFAFHPSRADFVFEQGVKLFHLSQQPSSIIPHAPYSASEKLLKLISDFAIENSSVLSIHNQETEDENLMFQSKTGKVIERIKGFGIETDFWNAPQENSIVATLKQLPKQLKIQLVHNTFTSEADMHWANDYNKNLYWCFCVNANKYIENRIPNIPLFIKNNCKITVGTDSLASNWSLNILDELKTISNAYPEISLQQLIQWSTINGADYLGFDRNLGSIEIGKTPGINLISNIENNQLTNKSEVVKIV
jgi:cytosine/adenosine deaminase-related metal-dependent hydrolase